MLRFSFAILTSMISPLVLADDDVEVDPFFGEMRPFNDKTIGDWDVGALRTLQAQIVELLVPKPAKMDEVEKYRQYQAVANAWYVMNFRTQYLAQQAALISCEWTKEPKVCKEQVLKDLGQERDRAEASRTKIVGLHPIEWPLSLQYSIDEVIEFEEKSVEWRRVKGKSVGFFRELIPNYRSHSQLEDALDNAFHAYNGEKSMLPGVFNLVQIHLKDIRSDKGVYDPSNAFTWWESTRPTLDSRSRGSWAYAFAMHGSLLHSVKFTLRNWDELYTFAKDRLDQTVSEIPGGPWQHVDFRGGAGKALQPYFDRF